MSCETVGLIEFTFAEFGGIKWDGDNVLPLIAVEMRSGGVNEESGQEGLEPKRAVVFVFVDEVEHAVAKDNNGASLAEVKFVIAAVGALESGGDGPFERKSTAFTKGRFNVMDVVAAGFADIALVGSGARVTADLADLRIDERERGI